jgi:DNA-binding beta-propeller fold protein YncE
VPISSTQSLFEAQLVAQLSDGNGVVPALLHAANVGQQLLELVAGRLDPARRPDPELPRRRARAIRAFMGRWLSAGASAPTELPFTGLQDPTGVSVDGGGTVYVAEAGKDQVLKLPAGGGAQTVLPFNGLDLPYGVAMVSARSTSPTSATTGCSSCRPGPALRRHCRLSASTIPAG